MTFNVVFKGILPGVDLANAKQSFAGLFGLESEKVDRIFASNNIVIKSNVSDSIAQKLVETLSSIGVYAEMQEVEQAAVAVSPEPASFQSNTPVVKPFLFSGVGGEYFKIWIVNILLTIVTLGIYSAWAKVRNKQYFYGNTTLDGASFEYTANPVKILIGRLIAVGIYAAFIISSSLSPALSIILALALFILIPFIIVSSVRFNARHSAYRNVSFRFHGGIGRAFVVFVLWPIVGLLTFTLMLPFAWKKQMDYLVGNHAYGNERFNINTQLSQFYNIYLLLIGASFAFFILLFIILSVFGGAAVLGMGGSGLGAGVGVFAMIAFFVIYIGFIVFVQAFMVVSMANIKYQNTTLDVHSFKSDWTLVGYAKIFLVNSVLTVLTLGLYIPFAKVRMAGYMAEHTQFVAVGNIDNFVAAEKENINTVAEGVHDIFDIDISI